MGACGKCLCGGEGREGPEKPLPDASMALGNPPEPGDREKLPAEQRLDLSHILRPLLANTVSHSV